MIHFSLDEKLMIAGGCAAAVLLFAVLMACKISPYCCLYRRCPLRARYEDDDDEMVDGKGKSKGKSQGNYQYHLVNYAHQAPPIPAVTLTSLEKSSSGAAVAAAMTFTGPTGAALPAYTALANAGNVPCKLQTVRSHKTSTSSVSGSSTVSSDSGLRNPSLHQIQSASSGIGSASSDGGEHPITQPPALDLAIRYNDEDEKLTIQIRGAVRVPSNIYGCTNDTYVQVLVIKDLKKRWRRKSDIPLDEILQLITTNANASAVSSESKSNSPPLTLPNLQQQPYELAEFKTQLIRRKMDPIFNEQFVTGVAKKDKKYTCIKFILRSIDRFSHHSIVGTCHVGLANLGESTLGDRGEEDGTSSFSIVLQPYTPDLGEMMLSLCYLPTAERLHVNVMKMTNLRPPTGMNTANPYIKAVIVRRGKVLEKHATSVQFHTLNPVFNESLIFDVPVMELEKITVLITVLHQDSSDVAEVAEDRGGGHHRSGGSTGSGGALSRRSSSANGMGGGGGRRRSVGNALDESSEDACPPLQKSRSIHSIRTKCYSPLGRLAFGSLTSVKGTCKHHWHEVLKHPRKQVAQWHKLQP